MSNIVFSERLRTLKNERGVTAQQMSEQTGIPKRTLEKYMLKSGAASPGIEAIRAVCTSFDVSADWLLGLSERSDQAVSGAEATEVAARAVFEHFIASINHTQKWAVGTSMGSVFKEGLLYGADPTELANDYAYQVLKLRAEIMAGNVGSDLRIGEADDGHRALNLNPHNFLKID